MIKTYNMWVYPQNAQKVVNALQSQNQNIQFSTTNGIHKVGNGCGCCYQKFPVVYFHIKGWTGSQFTKFLATLGLGRKTIYKGGI